MKREPGPVNEISERERLENLAAAPRRKLRAAIAKQQKLIDNLSGDLERHGDSELWKRYGDLLLANIKTAERRSGRILVTDYFDEQAPLVEIEGEDNKPISEIAEGYFRRYVKARNAREVIAARMAAARDAISKARQDLARIEEAVESLDEQLLSSLTLPKQKQLPGRSGKKRDTAFKGARRFVSSDGFEILVGKKAVDNDFLTFRVAKSLDMWLHAADYPGSHVVVRSSGKKDVPDRTLIEAAQLAAFYSDAREKPKAAVNYTQKKFVNKPRHSVPGLVSLASFKTIMVEPGISSKLTVPASRLTDNP